ncbi:hypothetical protein ACH4Y0_34550 [Streptomyces sp. NPDC020707]|uniref:hypothetical protein n=1 Tax=Streptomyces sp. NPDC020707 TaxID=3365084 RepID=UPI00378FEA93
MLELSAARNSAASRADGEAFLSVLEASVRVVHPETRERVVLLIGSEPGHGHGDRSLAVAVQ